MSDRKNSSHKSNQKAVGTRLGTLANWREGSQPSGKISDRYGRALREGR
jgi:hypothetical protein